MAGAIIPRPELDGVPPVPHGGHAHAEPADMLDFSSNVNPFGALPCIWEAMRSVTIERHPDPRAAPLRDALAERFDVHPAWVLAGNGSSDLIYQLAVTFIRPGDKVLIVEPTFGEYRAAAALMGATIVSFATRAAEGFALDIAALIRTAQQIQPRLLFLCNPNNPTGVFLDQASVAALLVACPSTLLVLDESYINFVANRWSARDLLAAGNLLILRSLTKDYALTGLRVGFALAAPEVIAALEKAQPPWSVNALAQAAAVAVLRNEGHLRATLAVLALAKAALVSNLMLTGFAPLPSAVNFFLLPVASAVETTCMLRERGIKVRDCTSFGLPAFVRIAAQRPEANAQLIAALALLRNDVLQK